MSAYIAHARWDALRRKMSMYVGNDHGNGTVTFVGPDGTAVDVLPGREPPPGVAWSIPPGAAHAIIDALSRELGLSDSAANMRSDYLHERDRVDVLMNSLMKRIVTE